MDDLLDAPSGRKDVAKKRSVTLIVLVLFQFLVLFVSVIYALDEIENIIPAGGVVLLVGFTTLIIAVIKKNVYAMILGGSALAAVLFIFLVIYLFQMSPGDARRPIPIVIVIYTLLFGFFGTFFVVGELRRPKGD